MGYLDRELGIKSVSGIKKYVSNHFKNKGLPVELDCVKVANSVRTFWAISDKLYTHDMKGSVIYVMQEHQLEELIQAIDNTIPVIRKIAVEY